jgi:hypothetical protein
LYVLESQNQTDSVESSTVLQRLVALLTSKDDNCVRKALYAISAASRGNADVQQALLDASTGDGFFRTILDLVAVTDCRTSSIEIERKVWSFVSDMLEELTYVKTGVNLFDRAD